jgi:hypothetical protein
MAGAVSVYAVDIDGDGDIDVLSASYNDDKIAWYENIDGQGTFSTEKTITTQANGARSVYAVDIDGGCDIDVLIASSSGVSWYDNRDKRILATKCNGFCNANEPYLTLKHMSDMNRNACDGTAKKWILLAYM